MYTYILKGRLVQIDKREKGRQMVYVTIVFERPVAGTPTLIEVIYEMPTIREAYKAASQFCRS